MLQEHFDEETGEFTGTYTITTDEGDDLEVTGAELDHEVLRELIPRSGLTTAGCQCELDIGGEIFKVPLDALCGEHEGIT